MSSPGVAGRGKPSLLHPRRSSGFVPFLLLLLSLAPSARAGDRVRLQLKWQHQFQFAGYYAAEAQGYYRAAGLEVEIIPGRPGGDAVQEVLDGKADFGVGATDLLLRRERGAPVVVLATVFQHSPLALAVLRQSGLETVHDLVGRKVMIEPGSTELDAYLRSEGISADRFDLLRHDFDVRDLLSGKVAAMSVYVTDEPFELALPGREYLLYTARAVGIDFYGDSLFTVEAQVERSPGRVRAFREASLKGWDYAMQHPEEVVQLVHARYSQRHGLDHLRFEARQMVPLLQASLVEIGHMNPGRWRRIAEVYSEMGMMRRDFDLSGFLYDPDPRPRGLTWIHAVLAAAALLALVATLTAIRLSRLSGALRRSEAIYRTILNASPDGIAITDTGGRILMVSPGAVTMFGYAREGELLGRPVTDFIVPEDRERAASNVALTFQGNGPGPVEYRSLRADASTFDMEANGEVIRDEQGRPVQMVSIVRDITERTRVRGALERSAREILDLNAGLERRVAERTAELEASSAELESFAYTVAHDLKAPLRGVHGFATLLAEAEGDRLTPEGRRKLERVREASARGGKLIEELLQLSALSRTRLRRERVDLCALAWSIAEGLRATAPSRQVAWEIEEGLLVEADARLARDLLSQLLQNAWKFTSRKEAARIELGRTEQGGLPAFFVRDDGAGFDMAHAGQLFGAFHRAHLESEFPGLGIGLAIAEKIVRRHGGKIWAEGEPGEGATFFFTLGSGQEETGPVSSGRVGERR